MIEATREHLGWALHESGPDGADHTVLLLPGALCTAAFYDDLLAEPSMSKTPIRFIATTLPGFGGTAPPEDMSMESYSKLAGKLASDLGCDAIVGHSLGANIAVEMASAGEFSGPLVLLSPSFSRKGESRFPRALDRLSRVLGHLPYSLIVHSRRPRECTYDAGLEVRDPDLAPVQVGARRERVRDVFAVGRGLGLGLVAPLVERPVLPGEAHARTVANVHNDQPRVLAVLDRDHEALVRHPLGPAPGNVRRVDERRRRAAGRRDEPDATLVDVREHQPVWGEPRCGVLPVRRRDVAGGQAPRKTLVEVEHVHVGRVASVLHEREQAPVLRDGERARAVGRRDRLEPPVGGGRRLASVRSRRSSVLLRPDPEAHAVVGP